jgi:CubicO group peptidase (beta-lactamase class C family)
VRRRRRRILLAAVVILVGLPGATFGWAFLSTDSSSLARALVWMDADVGDVGRFPTRTMAASTSPRPLREEPRDLSTILGPAAPGGDLHAFLRRTRTAAFIVLEDGAIATEEYFNGYREDSIVTTFSVAKSFVSALVGIAIDEGAIGGLDDPVTRYLPELLDRDGRFSAITVRHLLSMSSGLRFEERGLPWSDDAKTYYGTDLRRLALEDTEIVRPPGEVFAYNPYNTLLLGLVLERATGTSVSEFMRGRLWDPLGAGGDASWSLDSEAGGFEKMESGLNGRALDLTRLGLLYLEEGQVEGRQVVSEAWIAESTAVSDADDPSLAYQYHWWTYRDDDLGDWFLARGNKGQFIAAFPSANLVLSRFGEDFGYDDWPALLADFARAMR